MSTKTKTTPEVQEPNEPSEREQAITKSIKCHPGFMFDFYERKLKGTENLTSSPELVESRLEWAKNKERAERELNL